jgi:hypothetical protein
MKAETGEQKYNRLSKVLQAIMLRSYPNPERTDCPDLDEVEEVARLITDNISEEMKGNAHYEHIMHCSPCYAEFLDARHRMSPPRDPSYRMPRRQEKKLGKMMDQLEAAMKAVAKERG